MDVNPRVRFLHPGAIRGLFAVAAMACQLAAHDVVTTSVTFNKEIVRIFQARCIRCHREGGTAFSLETFSQARPWAQAIKEEVLSRRMPPWGAVKGFGEFRNDQGLSNENVETILSWIDGGVPEGDASSLPEKPNIAPMPAAPKKPTVIVSAPGMTLVRAMRLDGLLPMVVPKGPSMQITATLPDGTVLPLVWLEGYQLKFSQAFLFEEALVLPAGTRIDGLAPGAKVGLLPVRK